MSGIIKPDCPLLLSVLIVVDTDGPAKAMIYLLSLKILSEKYNDEGKKDQVDMDELDISSFSAMSSEESQSDLSFFKLNKSF